MLVDSHCHLSGSHIKENSVKAILDRAHDAGVTGFINVSSNLNDFQPILTLSKQYPEIQACLGIHPHEANSWDSNCEKELETTISSNKVLFVGEIGLDWHYDLSPRDQQELAFRSQIRLAKRHNKPVMIHTRQATMETIRILKEESADQVSGIIHCFSEDLNFARKVLDLGFYLSFSGILTFKSASSIRNIAAWAPEDRILIETDSPYLAPEPFRGKTNEPAFIVHTLAQMAKLRNVTSEHLAIITTNNLEALCGWPHIA